MDKIQLSFGISFVLITILDFLHTKTFEIEGLAFAIVFIYKPIQKIINHKHNNRIGYISGYLLKTSMNSIVLGMILVTYSSPFLVADTVTIALNEVMTFNHWLAFFIGIVLIISGICKEKSNNKS